MRSEFRFSPPSLELSGELDWVFARAFGPPGAPMARQTLADHRAALDAAERLGLAARIGARTPVELLEEELGDHSRSISETFLASAARAVASDGLTRKLAVIAAAAETPIVILKGMALQLAGHVTPGARDFCDVDVLVPKSAARDIQSAIIAVGFREADGPSAEHQLAPLFHATGLVVEVHTIVPGFRIGSGRDSATHDALMARGLSRHVGDLPEGCRIPTDDVLLAHALVHGIAHHGLAPKSYPMSRMIADVQDLDLDGEGWQRFLEGPFEWIERDVSREEVEAVADLVMRLDGGQSPAAVAANDGGAGRLLRHIAAGATDDTYRQSIRLRSVAHPLAPSSSIKTLLRNTYHAVWLTRYQVDVLYGKPKTTLGYWGWRLWRPVDLAVRTVRYGSAWVRSKVRSR